MFYLLYQEKRKVAGKDISNYMVRQPFVYEPHIANPLNVSEPIFYLATGPLED